MLWNFSICRICNTILLLMYYTSLRTTYYSTHYDVTMIRTYIRLVCTSLRYSSTKTSYSTCIKNNWVVGGSICGFQYIV